MADDIPSTAKPMAKRLHGGEKQGKRSLGI